MSAAPSNVLLNLRHRIADIRQIVRRRRELLARSMMVIAAAMLIGVAGYSVNIAQAQQGRAPVAPQWDIAEWINTDNLKLADLKGQVVIIDFFQMWCPGCNKFSLPLMARWEKVFAKEIEQKKLIIVSIHTVFEGHKVQTVRRLKKYLKRKGITHPVGVDRHAGDNRLPNTMISYNTNGTPEVALIGKQGRIRFQKFGYFEPSGIERFIRILLDE